MIRLSSAGKFENFETRELDAILQAHGVEACVTWNYQSIRDAFLEEGYTIEDEGIEKWFRRNAAILSHYVANEASQFIKTLVKVDIAGYEVERLKAREQEDTDAEGN